MSTTVQVMLGCRRTSLSNLTWVSRGIPRCVLSNLIAIKKTCVDPSKFIKAVCTSSACGRDTQLSWKRGSGGRLYRSPIDFLSYGRPNLRQVRFVSEIEISKVFELKFVLRTICPGPYSALAPKSWRISKSSSCENIWYERTSKFNQACWMPHTCAYNSQASSLLEPTLSRANLSGRVSSLSPDVPWKDPCARLSARFLFLPAFAFSRSDSLSNSSCKCDFNLGMLEKLRSHFQQERSSLSNGSYSPILS